MVRSRREQLLTQGYNAKVVDLALEWAEGAAGGMVDYVLKEGADAESVDREKLVVQFLPRYLTDCENWIRSFGNEPIKHK